VRPILVGAVVYDPKVTVIWDIIARFFAGQHCPIDGVYYTNYTTLVDALLAGHVDIAWNSPLAWVDAQRRTGGTCRALAMRDTDRDRVTHVLVRADGPVRTLADLRGRTIAVGASDSPQATLLPLHHLHKHRLVAGPASGGYPDVNVLRHDVLVGKHGDHVGGERDALQALLEGRAEAAAVLDLNWRLWSSDGTADPARVRVLETTAPFDHCNFTASDRFATSLIETWTRVLLSMDYANPAHREMMDMEGLKRWLPGRTTGYAALEAAVDEQAFFEAATR